MYERIYLSIYNLIRNCCLSGKGWLVKPPHKAQNLQVLLYFQTFISRLLFMKEVGFFFLWRLLWPIDIIWIFCPLVCRSVYKRHKYVNIDKIEVYFLFVKIHLINFPFYNFHFPSCLSYYFKELRYFWMLWSLLNFTGRSNLIRDFTRRKKLACKI